MERVTTQQLAMMPIEFKLNGKTVIGRPDETIIETAKKSGVEIPHLCYKPGMRPDGNCRACVVEIKGERALALDLDHAGAAVAIGPHAGLVAEVRDLDAA